MQIALVREVCSAKTVEELLGCLTRHVMHAAAQPSQKTPGTGMRHWGVIQGCFSYFVVMESLWHAWEIHLVPEPFMVGEMERVVV